MSVHWHDDELEWCPCDEGERAFPEVTYPAAPEVILTVDYDTKADRWAGLCGEHGMVAHVGGSTDDHNLVLIQLAQHDEKLHGGDGKVHWSAWLR